MERPSRGSQNHHEEPPSLSGGEDWRSDV